MVHAVRETEDLLGTSILIVIFDYKCLNLQLFVVFFAILNIHLKIISNFKICTKRELHLSHLFAVKVAGSRMHIFPMMANCSGGR